MGKKNIKHQMFFGVAWSYAERLIAQIISFIVAVVLARLIEPEKYGIVSIVTVLISLADTFVSGGFGSALVQKKDADDLDYNTTFVLGIILGFGVYGLLFVLAPYIALFYNMDELTYVIRVMGIRLPVAAINTVQHAVVQRRMEFRKFFFSTLFGTLLSAVIGIGMALKGCGVWALVGQYLSNTVIDTIVLLFIGNWCPKIQLSTSRIKRIWTFGWKVLSQKLVYTLTNNIQSLVIGKKFSPEDLAYYNNGIQMPQVVLSNVLDAIAKVVFPAISSIQDENERVKKMIRESIKIVTFVLAPVTIGILVVAEPLVLLFFTEKWRMCIPFFQIYCLRYLPRPHSTILQQATFAKGRSDIVLKIEIILNSALLIILVITTFCFKSIYAIAWGTLIDAVVGIICYADVANKLFDYSLKEQLEDFMPGCICAILMGIVVIMENMVEINDLVLLFIQIITGITVYIILSLVINRSLTKHILDIVETKLKSYINMKIRK